MLLHGVVSNTAAMARPPFSRKNARLTIGVVSQAPNVPEASNFLRTAHDEARIIANTTEARSLSLINLHYAPLLSNVKAASDR